MTMICKIWTAAAVLFCLASSDAALAASRSSVDTVPKRPVIKKSDRPVLRSLTPQVDLSNEPDPSDLFDQAVKEYAAGHLPQAEKLFDKVIELDPLNADANFNMGAIKEWRNDWPAALSHYKAALRAKPKDPEIAEAVRAVEYKVKNRAAIVAATTRMNKEREVANHSKMAKEAFANQNYGEAIVHLSYLANAMPDDAKIQFALGQSLRALKNFDWAAYRLKMAIYLDPENDLYRKTLVDLDKEIQDIQGQAFSDSADLAISRLQPLQFTELADIGMRHAQF